MLKEKLSEIHYKWNQYSMLIYITIGKWYSTRYICVNVISEDTTLECKIHFKKMEYMFMGCLINIRKLTFFIKSHIIFTQSHVNFIHNWLAANSSVYFLGKKNTYILPGVSSLFNMKRLLSQPFIVFLSLFSFPFARYIQIIRVLNLHTTMGHFS